MNVETVDIPRPSAVVMIFFFDGKVLLEERPETSAFAGKRIFPGETIRIWSESFKF